MLNLDQEALPGPDLVDHPIFLSEKREEAKNKLFSLLRLWSRIKPRAAFVKRAQEELLIDRSNLVRLNKLLWVLDDYNERSEGVELGKSQMVLQRVIDEMICWDQTRRP